MSPSGVPPSAVPPPSVLRPAESEEPPFVPSSRRKRRIAWGALLLFGALSLLVVLRAAMSAESHPHTLETSLAPTHAAVPSPESPPITVRAAAPSSEAAVVAMAIPSASLQMARTHERSTTTRPAVPPPVRPNPPSPVPRASSNTPSETTNCSPPFYYEGKKKIFKAGCI
jgi:hypothetical protein